MNSVNQKCRVGDRGGPFSEGVGYTKAASGADAGAGAGGPAVKTKPVGSGAATNRMAAQSGRRNAREVHHNGGLTSIGQGSTNPPR